MTCYLIETCTNILQLENDWALRIQDPLPRSHKPADRAYATSGRSTVATSTGTRSYHEDVRRDRSAFEISADNAERRRLAALAAAPTTATTGPKTTGTTAASARTASATVASASARGPASSNMPPQPRSSQTGVPTVQECLPTNAGTKRAFLARENTDLALNEPEIFPPMPPQMTAQITGPPKPKRAKKEPEKAGSKPPKPGKLQTGEMVMKSD